MQLIDGESSTSEALRRLALPLAERVLDDRFDHLPRTWIGPVARFGSAEWSPGVLGYDLYAGRVGPALALAYAGKQLNSSSLLQPAYEVFGRSAEILKSTSFELRSLLSAGFGGYSGIPGLFWSLNAAGRYLGEQSWVEISNKSWDIITADLAHMTADSFDMINGTSSAIVMQCKSTGSFPYNESIVNSWASHAMRRVELRGQELTLGLAHGLAHIIWFFSEIAKVCPTVECHKIVQFVDSLISDNYRNRDGIFQSYTDQTRDSISSSWCNGHAGLLLAYASATEANIETKVHCTEIVRQIASNSVSLIPVLCHGGLGVLDVLRKVAKLYPDAQSVYDKLVESAFTEQAILSYFEMEKGRYALSPGLMCGRAGAVLYLASKHSSDHKLSALSLDL
ncbi:lanthionine synthetase LanC family protein [Arcanobacterium hippocoleae]|uniref:lanthionine synthetase LanC family protein n=1 Tax=Arcanobacterium hippocoleae TaxID=149017 RepID=UPI003A6879A5